MHSSEDVKTHREVIENGRPGKTQIGLPSLTRSRLGRTRPRGRPLGLQVEQGGGDCTSRAADDGDKPSIGFGLIEVARQLAPSHLMILIEAMIHEDPVMVASHLVSEIDRRVGDPDEEQDACDEPDADFEPDEMEDDIDEEPDA